MTTLATIGVLIAAVGGMIGGIAALVAAFTALRTRGDVLTVKVQLNDHLHKYEEAMEALGVAEHAKGMIAGKAAAKAEEKS